MSNQRKEGIDKMRKIYETPDIVVTKFDIDRSIMETDNQGDGDHWNAGIPQNPESETSTWDNPDIPL